MASEITAEQVHMLKVMSENRLNHFQWNSRDYGDAKAVAALCESWLEMYEALRWKPVSEQLPSRGPEHNAEIAREAGRQARKEALAVAIAGVIKAHKSELAHSIRAEFARRWPEEFRND